MAPMKQSFILLSSVLGVLAAAACGVERTSSVLGPTTTSATSVAKSSAPSLLGTWVVQGTSTASSVTRSTVTSLPDFSSCGNFQWAVTAQTASEASGKFSADCAGGVALAGTITAHLGAGTTIPIAITGSLTRSSENCAFTLTGEGTQVD